MRSFHFPVGVHCRTLCRVGARPEKCVVIANGQVNLGDDFDRTQHSRAVNRFGFFGQFIDNKGVDVILEALLILGQRTAHSRLRHSDRDQRRQQALCVPRLSRKDHAAGRGAKERFRAAASRCANTALIRASNLPSGCASIDWVLVPSTWWEIFGLVVSEAWMFGRPVIASDIAGAEGARQARRQRLHLSCARQPRAGRSDRVAGRQRAAMAARSIARSSSHGRKWRCWRRTKVLGKNRLNGE